MAVEIRLLQETEIELANNFFNEIYKTNRLLENFKWEFVSGPAGKAIYVVAVDTTGASTKVVGTQCAIPLELIAPDGRIILTAKSEDTLVHPDYRGQKLFEKMYDLLFAECAKAGIKYIWGFTPALKAFERIGFDAPFKTRQALMVIRPFAAYTHLVSLNQKNTIASKLKIFGLSMFSWIKGWTRLFTASSSLKCDTISPGDKDDLLKLLYSNAARPYFVRQNERYNDWRLTKNPFHNHYINISVSGDKGIDADVLLNVRSDVSYIEQILFATTITSAERASIVKTAVKKLIQSRTPVIRVLCFDNQDDAAGQINLLKKNGFVSLNRGSYFVWKSLDLENTISFKDIFFSRLFTQGNL